MEPCFLVVFLTESARTCDAMLRTVILINIDEPLNITVHRDYSYLRMNSLCIIKHDICIVDCIVLCAQICCVNMLHGLMLKQ